MMPFPGLCSSPTLSWPRTQLISEFLSAPPVVVAAVTPAVLNVQSDGLTVIGYVNVVLLGTLATVKVPT